MIYAYDEPVALPTVDLYDSTAMQLYINAAREMYKQSQEELKEFLKNYGDFYSPIANDVDNWYNSTIIPLRNIISEALARGIDLTRSQEGRAILSKYESSVPYADLAKMKQSAKAAEVYLENRAKMEAAGIYNPEYENFILERMGMSPIEQWDSRKNGIWQRQSPGEYKNLHDATFQWVDNNKERFLYTTKDNRYDVYGVSDEDIRASLSPHLSGFVGGDLGKWYYEKAKQELISEGKYPTNREIMLRLQDNIVTANREYTYQTRRVNDYTKAAYENALDLQTYAKKKAIDYSYAKKQREDEQQERSSIPYWSEKLKYNMAQSANQHIRDNVVKYITYGYERAVKMYNLAVLHGNKKEKEEWKMKKKYWSDIIKDEQGIFNPKYKMFNKDGSPTENMIQTANLFSSEMRSGGRNIDNLYTYKPVAGTEDHKIGTIMLAGSEKEENIIGYGNKHLPVTLSSGDITFTPVRDMQAAGKTSFKNPLAVKFNNWLHSRGPVGALVDKNIYYNMVPKGTAASPSVDINGQVTITGAQFREFCKDIGKENDELEVAKKLGISAYIGNQKVTKRNVSDGFKQVEFYRIPITRTIDANGTTVFGDVNVQEHKGLFGGAKAYENATEATDIGTKF